MTSTTTAGMGSHHTEWVDLRRAAWRLVLGATLCSLIGCATTKLPVPAQASASAPAPVPTPARDEPRLVVPLPMRDAAADPPTEPVPSAATPAAVASPQPQPQAGADMPADSPPPSAEDPAAGEAQRPATPAVEEAGPEVGLASWYGGAFQGRRTALGERFDMHRMTAAHKTMPLPSFALVRNRATGKEVVVRVNDRGPFIVGRIIDLSRAAAREIGILGIGQVEVQRLAAGDSRVREWHARARPVVPKPRRVAAR